MFISTEIYIENEDKIDWEPDQRFTIIWLDGRRIKLAISRTKARELRNLLSKLIGRNDRGKKRRATEPK